jgi:ATP-binding cassette subfamily F protein 3
VVLDQVCVGYDQGPTVLSQLSQRLDPGDRIGLLGANGNGKSTFAQLITGTLAPRSGTITRCPKLKIGYFSQHHTDALDVHTTASGLLMQDGQFTLTQARGHLGRFGLSGDLAETPIGHLSGGEKARLSLALLCRQAPHILILDEPTNHLDMDSRQALKQALNEFEGAIILITHDWDLLEATVDTLWLVADAKVMVFDGDLQDYRRVLLSPKTSPKAASSKSAAPKAASSKVVSSNGGSLNGGSSKSSASVTKSIPDIQSFAQRIVTDPIVHGDLKAKKKALTQAQKVLDDLEIQLRDVLKLLEDPKLYQGYSPELEGLVARKAGLEKEVKAAEDAWLEAVAGLEALEH